MGKDLARTGMRALQRSGEGVSGKKTAGAQALGQDPARGLGKKKRACVTAEERGDAKRRMRPEKEAGAAPCQAFKALVQWLSLWD